MLNFSLMGGIGNFMFQTATAEWMGKVYNKAVCYPNAKEHFKHLLSFGKWVAHSAEYHSVFENVDWYKHYNQNRLSLSKRKMPFKYERFVPKDNVEYQGYFQSAKNFDTDYARHLFTPTNRVKQRVDEIMDKYNGTITCSLHVRRGNYVGLQDKHVLQPMEYYAQATTLMANIGGATKFLVFSDDIEWCKEHFTGASYDFIEDTDYIEMFCMSRCNHNIIANSSFSWWGAMLGNPSIRTVIAPSNWFPNNITDSSDIIPENWIKL